MQNRDTTLNGHDFHIREWGPEDAPILLMLHGFPEFGGAWAELAERLSDRWRCVAPDQRGYGQSWAPPEVEHYKVRELVSDMVALIEELGQNVTVVGHDWGAAVAYGLAIARPDLVDNLIILNGVHPGPMRAALVHDEAQRQASQYINFLRREGSEDVLAAEGCEKMMEFFSRGKDMSWLTPELREDYVREWSRPGRLRGMVNWYRASPLPVPAPGEEVDDTPLPPEKFRVRMPHLLIWGMGDKALLPVTTDGLEAYCDDLTRAEITEADHWVIHQRPDQVAQIIRAWLVRDEAA